MGGLFDIKCRNCGAPVGFDIAAQTYRCPHCGEISGIQEARRQADFRRLNHRDRTVIASGREMLSCPGCGAELLYEQNEEAALCPFCGSTPIRKEFEQSDQFPDYIIPFVLTAEEAKAQLKDWAQHTGDRLEGKLVLDHLEQLQGCYLPYSLVRGPVTGYVLRENVNREFKVRGFLENTLINTSRQLDNETLDATEPFDLQALRPFEHGFLAGHRVKLADLSGAKRQRRTLQEAGAELRRQLIPRFHTDGIRVNLYPTELMEIPILLPMYFLKIGRRLAVVNGQTGKAAVKTGHKQRRSPRWLLEPLGLTVLILCLLWLITGSLFLAFVACPPLLIVIWTEFTEGRFSLFGNVILEGKQTRARRRNQVLELTEEPMIRKNPFPTAPVFWEMRNGVPTNVDYRFYPAGRVAALIFKVFGLYFLPLITGAILHYILGIGSHFRLIGVIPWFWIFGIFTMVYIFSGIRCDAYEHPYTYTLAPRRLVGPAAGRRLPFFACIGMDPRSMEDFACRGKGQAKLTQLYLLFAGILVVSVLTIIL